MKVKILTLFPEYFSSIFNTSILKKAIDKNILEVSILNIRDFATDKHRITDDRPFGGGAGMVMKVGPIHNALKSIGYDVNSKPSEKHKVLLTSAKGEKFTQNKAYSLTDLEELVLICGHYEGVDERVSQLFVDEEVRIGDYVLTGGEPAAAVIIDAVARLLPGVLGNEESTDDESHGTEGKLGYPCYTRPANYLDYNVPDVLLSGNHEAIQEWRKNQQKYEKKHTRKKN